MSSSETKQSGFLPTLIFEAGPTLYHLILITKVTTDYIIER